MLTIKDLASATQLRASDMSALRGGSNINVLNSNFAFAGGFGSPAAVVARSPRSMQARKPPTACCRTSAASSWPSSSKQTCRYRDHGVVRDSGDPVSLGCRQERNGRSRIEVFGDMQLSLQCARTVICPGRLERSKAGNRFSCCGDRAFPAAEPQFIPRVDQAAIL
jgi:hypothetical protein